MMVLTLSTIYGGWKIAGKISKKLRGQQKGNPTNSLGQRQKDFTDNFLNSINKTPSFDDLPGAQQRKLIEDLSLSPDDDLIKALGKNNELIDTWKKMDNLNADDAIRRNPGAIEALNKPWKQRPEPETYLEPGYLSNHRQIFQDDIVRVTSQAKIDEFGTLGPKDAFVMTRTEYNAIIQEHGRNLRVFEEKLGFETGSLSDDTIFVGIKRQDLSEIKMPTGNESGANLAKWIPGGKTSGEVFEGIVDLSQFDTSLADIL